MSQLSSVVQTLSERGYCHWPADEARAALADCSDWTAFAASWNGMPLDGYMADGGRYRRRRYAVYRLAADGTAERQPHQPHWQDLSYNALNGGVARWFEPVADAVGNGATMRSVLQLAAGLFGRVAGGAADWHAEVHQFRIEAGEGMAGKPTPEGSHRDGVDYVLVMLVARHNIAEGTTTVASADGRPLGAFTLTTPFDMALVDDRRVYHGVTAVTPLDPSAPAYRDVLVVTLRRP